MAGEELAGGHDYPADPKTLAEARAGCKKYFLLKYAVYRVGPKSRWKIVSLSGFFDGLCHKHPEFVHESLINDEMDRNLT